MTTESALVRSLPSTLVSLANFDMAAFSAASKSLLYLVEKIGLGTDPCGTPLVSGSHSE